jgi:hypothetical protein
MTDKDKLFLEDITNYILETDRLAQESYEHRGKLVKYLHERSLILNSWLCVLIHQFFDGEITLVREDLSNYTWSLKIVDENETETTIKVLRTPIYEQD